jgi:hypothetical protein
MCWGLEWQKECRSKKLSRIINRPFSQVLSPPLRWSFISRRASDQGNLDAPTGQATGVSAVLTPRSYGTLPRSRRY